MSIYKTASEHVTTTLWNCRLCLPKPNVESKRSMSTRKGIKMPKLKDFGLFDPSLCDVLIFWCSNIQLLAFFFTWFWASCWSYRMRFYFIYNFHYFFSARATADEPTNHFHLHKHKRGVSEQRRHWPLTQVLFRTLWTIKLVPVLLPRGLFRLLKRRVCAPRSNNRTDRVVRKSVFCSGNRRLHSCTASCAPGAGIMSSMRYMSSSSSSSSSKVAPRKAYPVCSDTRGNVLPSSRAAFFRRALLVWLVVVVVVVVSPKVTPRELGGFRCVVGWNEVCSCRCGWGEMVTGCWNFCGWNACWGGWKELLATLMPRLLGNEWGWLVLDRGRMELAVKLKRKRRLKKQTQNNNKHKITNSLTVLDSQLNSTSNKKRIQPKNTKEAKQQLKREKKK